MGKIIAIKLVWQEDDQQGEGWFNADVSPTEDLFTTLERAIIKAKETKNA